MSYIYINSFDQKAHSKFHASMYQLVQRVVIELQNLKATWKMLNNIMGRNKQNHNDSSVIINDNEVTDYQLIANKFNEYFSTVAEKLMEKIPHTNENPLKYLENQSKSSLFLSATSPSEI